MAAVRKFTPAYSTSTSCQQHGCNAYIWSQFLVDSYNKTYVSQPSVFAMSYIRTLEHLMMQTVVQSCIPHMHTMHFVRW